MGLYDTLDVEGCKGAQVKCWFNDMRTLREGDLVPALTPEAIYAVALREGGFLVIINNEIDRWQKGKPVTFLVFDKWGDLFDSKYPRSIMGEPYFFKDDDDGSAPVLSKLR